MRRSHLAPLVVIAAGLPRPFLGAAEPVAIVTASAAPAPGLPVVRRLAPRNVTATREQNEWNPRFSTDGRYLSFERRNGAAQAVFVADLDTPAGPVERISSQPPKAAASAEEALLGTERPDDSFNAQLSFYPDAQRFVFTGNGGTGVYRLYEGKRGGGTPQALSAQSKEDGHPAVSPDGRWLVYVSARAGLGKLFLRDLTTGVERQLTSGEKVDLYPAWSPDSKSVAYTSGDNDNHDVFVVDVAATPAAPRQLTTWKYDDLRPTFSADGALVAFYSNYSPSGEDKEWSIVTTPADGSGPSKGSLLAKRVAATNVVKDPEVGPAWLSSGHVLVYARNIKAEWNPIYAVDADTHEEARVETETRMNHDLVCSSRGVLAFRAQVGSWDDVFVAPVVKGAP